MFYLIAGPSRVGKTSLALRLAQALNCDAPQPPCRACRSCRHIESGLHPDVRVIQLAGGEGDETASGPRARIRRSASTKYAPCSAKWLWPRTKVGIRSI